MASKLWEKNFSVNEEIERFTVGRDRELDIYLAKYDVLGSMAHITMLESIGLMQKNELVQLLAELKNIYAECERGEFVIEEGVEDVHSQVELMLTRRLGDMGKKIHSGRSRNDQVLVDLKLFTRHELREVVERVDALFRELQKKSEQYKNVLMPGYTHLSDSHAEFVRTLVWRTCRVACRRHALPSGCLSTHQSQSPWFGCRLWLVIPIEP